MKKYFFLLVFVFSLYTTQSQNIKFNRLYSYTTHLSGNEFNQVLQRGSNYIAFGRYDTVHGYLQPVCAKFDSTGNLIFWKSFKDTLKSYGLSIYNTDIKTNDGGYIISGSIWVQPNTYKGFLMKLDSNLNIQWRNYYYDSIPNSLWTYRDYAFQALKITPDNGFLATGIRYKNNGYFTCLAVKFDSLGNVQWAKTYNDNYYLSQFANVITQADGSYIFGGLINPTGNPKNNSAFVMKTDSIGNIIWQRTLGGTEKDSYVIVQNHPDNSIMIYYSKCDSAVITQGYYEGYSIHQFHKLSSITGDTIWSLSYGLSKINQVPFVFRVFSDGSAMASGTYGFVNTDPWLLHINSEGTVDWYKEYKVPSSNFNSSFNNLIYDLHQTIDSGFIVSGVIRSNDSIQGTCGWLLKTDKNGCWKANCDSANYIQPNVKLESSLEIYPNPASSDVTAIYFSDTEQGKLEIYNTMGTKVMEVKLPKGQNNYKFSIAHLAKGYYKVILKEKGTLRGQQGLIVE